MDSNHESQVDAARRMYDNRAPTYEDDFHPAYSRRFMDLVKACNGDRVLDLACGTGLEAFIAAEQVGRDGEVIGVDVSEKMLSVAKERRDREAAPQSQICFLSGDATRLEGVQELEGRREGFDLILCSNAFVLFENPSEVVRGWRHFLKHGGRLIVDITHERNFVAGTVLSRASKRLGVPFPLSREWVRSVDSFKDVLEGAGYAVERVELLENITGHGNSYHDVDDADEQFNWIVARTFTPQSADQSWRDAILPVFREEWAKAAVDGKVENVDGLYVYIARK